MRRKIQSHPTRTRNSGLRLTPKSDKKSYKVEIDDEEVVLAKKRKGPDFAIDLVESTVEGTRANFDRE